MSDCEGCSLSVGREESKYEWIGGALLVAMFFLGVVVGKVIL